MSLLHCLTAWLYLLFWVPHDREVKLKISIGIGNERKEKKREMFSRWYFFHYTSRSYPMNYATYKSCMFSHCLNQSCFWVSLLARHQWQGPCIHKMWIDGKWKHYSVWENEQGLKWTKNMVRDNKILVLFL